MLFESPHVRVSAEYGIGTLWLAFPGAPVNALDAARLNELNAAVAAVERNPFLNALVVRSAKPAGFCAGLHPDTALISDRASFAAHGQRVFARLAAVPFTTIALIDGPCLDAGLELALACDHRLCVATATTHIGFPARVTGFGGGPRLRARFGRRAAAFIESGRTLSGREALALGLVDRAFCARRAKIDLRTFLDELERRPRVPARAPDDTGFAQERARFVLLTSPPEGEVAARLCGRRVGGELLSDSEDLPPHPARKAPPTSPRRGLQGQPGFPLTSGGEVKTSAPPTDVATLLARGFITPLEAEQMRALAKPQAATPSLQLRAA